MVCCVEAQKVKIMDRDSGRRRRSSNSPPSAVVQRPRKRQRDDSSEHRQQQRRDRSQERLLHRNERRRSHRSRRRSDRESRRRRRQRSTSSSYSSSPHHSPESPIHRLRRGVVSVEGIDETAGARKKGRGKLSPSRSRSSAHDDTVKHYRGGPNDIIHDGQKNQYQVVTEVGIGTFGRVLKCMDLRRRDFVAIKIVRDVKRYYESALVEARIMQDINRQGGRGLSHCVRLFDSFTFHGHYCMVLENLGPSLYDFLKKHEYQPFPMICVQDFTVQLLATLEFLHSLRLIHTDLKIENILLMNDRETIHNQQRVPESTRIKVIDFGGACYDSDKKSSLINTRQYRAPEVILGTGWSMPSDIWSLGCLLVELYQGDLLFATHDNYEHLALVERIIGPFPRNMIKDARSGSNCITVSNVFDSAGHMHRLDSILSPDSARFVRKTESLSDIIRNPNDEWFLNLLRRMLVIDPGQRLTAHECLRYLSRLRRDVVRCA